MGVVADDCAIGWFRLLWLLLFMYLTEATMMEFEKLTAEERLIAEQAVLNFRSLNQACDDAKHGTVLAVAERLALIQGRKLIQQTLQTSLELQARTIEKKVK